MLADSARTLIWTGRARAALFLTPVGLTPCHHLLCLLAYVTVTSHTTWHAWLRRNECGMPKLVCTTLRPLRPASPLMTDLEGISNFVADWMSYEPPEPPQQPPRTLVAPDTALNAKVSWLLLKGMRHQPLPVQAMQIKAPCAC